MNDDIEQRPTLFPEPHGYRLYLLRVNPRHKRISDPITQRPIFEALHNIESCIGDDQVRRLSEVRESLMAFTNDRLTDDKRHLLAEGDLWTVLRHPQSPYGLAWRPRKKSRRKSADMLVVYRGRQFT